MRREPSRSGEDSRWPRTAAEVPAGYSVRFVLDHQSLVAAGKARADGADLRVKRFDGEGWQEMARVVDVGSAWNGPTTELWFRTEAPVSASGADQNYYLFYGNDSAANPPDDPREVFLFWDGFESDSLNQWLPENSYDFEYFGVVSNEAHSGARCLRVTNLEGEYTGIQARGVDELDVVFDAYWKLSSVAAVDISQGVRARRDTFIDMVETNYVDGAGWDLAVLDELGWTEVLPAPEGQRPLPFVWRRVSVSTFEDQTSVLLDGRQVVPVEGTQDMDVGLPLGSAAFRVAGIPEGQSWWIDDVRVRRYVSPEPTVHVLDELEAAR